MGLKEDVINGIIAVEGGYVNDPNDSGGETNYGITKAVARKFGYEGDMKNLIREMAYHIYSVRYWDALSLDDIERIAPKIAEEMADTGVNMGVGRAATFLQVALNAFNNKGAYYADIMEDGDIGPGTMRALKSFVAKRGEKGQEVLRDALNCQQGAFYIDLTRRRQKDEAFVYGWFLHRINFD